MSYHAATCLLLLGPEFEAVRTAVGQHAALPHFLMRQMLEHTLPAAVDRLEAAAGAAAHATASQAPENLLQAWRLAMAALRVLLNADMSPAAQLYFQRHRPAVLRLAERLIASLPLEREQASGDTSLLSAWHLAACLLAKICSVLADRPAALQQSSLEAEQERQATAWAVVRCLPRLAAAVPLPDRVLEMDWPSRAAHTVVGQSIYQLLKQPAAIKDIDSCEQLRQLLAGTDAALHIVVALAPLTAGQETEAADAALDAGMPFLQHCGSVAHNFFSSAAGGQPVPAAQLPAVVSAAVQLHADGCRLVHRFIPVGHAAGTLWHIAAGNAAISVAAKRMLLAATQTAAHDAANRWGRCVYPWKLYPLSSKQAVITQFSGWTPSPCVPG